MKKISMRVIFLLTVLCMLFLSGCQGQGEAATETAEEFWARPHEWQSEHLRSGNANEYGYYYLNGDRILSYFDYTAKQSVPLCNKVGCTHEDFNCEGFIGGARPIIFFYEEKLCLITDDENGMHVYRCDLDATNREDKILLMKDEMEKGNAVAIENILVNGDEFYYKAVYQEPADDSGEFKHPISAVRRVDLKKWTDEEICRSQESELLPVSVDADGILIFERLNPDTLEKALGRESKDGEEMFSYEEVKKMPAEAFYCDKKTHSKLSLYKSNSAETGCIEFAVGSCMYRIGHPDDASGVGVMGVEKMDMHTGESEWLWNENAGPLSVVTECWRTDKHIYFNIADYEKNAYWTEVYSLEKFEKIELPFFDEYGDVISHEDEHGYLVYRYISNESAMDFIFIPIEEADKENPKYTVVEAANGTVTIESVPAIN